MNKVVIYGAGVVGRMIYDIHKEKTSFYAFIDRDVTGKYCGLPIFHPSEISKRAHLLNAWHVISVMSIRDVVNTLTSNGTHCWLAGGGLLSDFDTTQTNLDYVIDDERYQIESVKRAHSAFLHRRVFLRSIDIMITEKCSLKCRDCSNLMQYFLNPQNYDIDEVITDVDLLLENVDEILEARILGGDAFMHPEWARIANYLAQSEKVRRVVVYTNGAILPKNSTRELSLVNPKIIVAITDYGKLSKKLGSLVDFLRHYKIWHKIAKPTDWIDCAYIKKHNRTPIENNILFQNCVANNLLTMVHGEIHRCPFAASAALLGVTTQRPCLDITTISKRTISDYISSNKAMDACDYCDSRILTKKIPPAVQTKEVLKYVL